MKRIVIFCVIFFVVALGGMIFPAAVQAQDPIPEETPAPEEQPEAPEQVVGETEATEWFAEPTVRVDEGVVFLDGRTTTEEYRVWAGDLARNTQDVVAVVNRIEVIPRPAWDFTPALTEIRTLWQGAIRALPLLVFGVVVLALAWWLTRAAALLAKRFFRDRLGSPLLVSLASYTIAIPIFLLGMYIVLQVAGLTRLALTVLGGTGIVGIALGFAFQDITENFLASVLLSIRHPFESKDLIEVAGYMGIVQNMNTRSTVLMTLEGNHIQIPNATIFKSTIINYSANPNRREVFDIGIGYEDSIVEAQELIAQILNDHPAVLDDPEPLVLADAMGAATINLRVYFWYDANLYAPIKVKSSLIRLTKRSLTDAGITMPDEAREVIFPQGVPVVQAGEGRLLEERPDGGQERPNAVVEKRPEKAEPVSNVAEGNLHSEEADIQEQAERSRNPEEGEDLLARPDGRGDLN